MKHLLPLIIVLFSTSSATAGDIYQPWINTYDGDSGLYFRAVLGSQEKGISANKRTPRPMVNVAIYDPAKGTSSLLFKESQQDGIVIVLFETGLKESSMEFGGFEFSSVVKNNTRVTKRDPRDKLLVGVRRDDARETTLFVSDKKGNDLRKVAVVPLGADWHLDVRNAKIRVVHLASGEMKIDNYEW